MSDMKLARILNRPLSRRQFLRYSAATGIGVSIGAGTMNAWAQGTQGGTLTWLGHQEVAGLGPNDIGPDVQASVIFNVLNPLVHVNYASETEPILARSYEVAPDGLSYTFVLHEGVMFHDGSELTAEDVKYTFETYSEPGNTVASRFNGMREVEVVDRYTARVHMDTVNAAFLRLACEVPIVPMAYHEEVGVDGFRTAPIGTGAFRVDTWRPAEFTELVAFPDHFRGAPLVDRLRLEVVPEPSVRYIALLTGDAQATVWPLSIEDSIELSDNPDFRVIATNWNSPRFIPLNNEVPQLSDRRVRQAMLSAIDRQRILDELESGFGVVASSHLAPHNPFFNPDVPQYPFDPERARSLLEGAGWVEGGDGIRSKDGLRLAFTCTTISGDQTRRPMAELSQIFLRAVGVDMQLAEAPVASILQGLREGNLEASLFNWTHGALVDPSPQSTLRSDGGDNFTRYNNPEMDRLIDEGLTIVDPELRRPIYNRTQEIYAEDVPALMLHYNQGINVFSNEMTGLPDDVLVGTPVFYRGNEYGRG
ncbi:MAG: ABC transporter substrate-binding protein [Trueperaceae bacterium]|nr:MAG: ABC transporter substrate-binding protein [Trueperaceae bacterium]